MEYAAEPLWADDDATETRTTSTLVLGNAMSDDTPLFDAATRVERALFEASGGKTSNEYRRSVRELAANLRRNDVLAADVREGRTTAEALVRMSALEMATESAKREREEMEARALSRRTRKHFDDGVNTEAYVCPQCRTNECKYVMLSDNRDIRKAEIWGGGDEECLALIQCQQCQYEWRESVL